MGLTKRGRLIYDFIKIGTDTPRRRFFMSEIELKYQNITNITPYARNSRTHSDEQVAQVAASIKEFGWTNPILIDETSTIIAGHGRLMAAQRLGLEQVPTITLQNLTDAQKKAYVIADNKLALNAGWDEEMLAVEIEELLDQGYDTDLLGFEADEIDSLLAGANEVQEGLTDEDAVPDVQETSVSVNNDVWILGKHRLMCGDSTLLENINKLMDNQKADVVFSDPPYGMKLNADWSSAKSKLNFASEKGIIGGKKHNNVIGDHDDFNEDLINTVLNNFNYCKEIFLWGADYYSELLHDKNDGSWVVWDKRLEESADKMYGSTFELCWSKFKHKRKIARVKWACIFGTEQEFDKKRHHPTQKPIKLVEWFINEMGLQDKKLFVDLYGGSGSTILACEKTNRKCYMMELDPKYVDVIIKRWQDFTGKDATNEGTGKTFNELSNKENT